MVGASHGRNEIEIETEIRPSTAILENLKRKRGEERDSGTDDHEIHGADDCLNGAYCQPIMILWAGSANA